MRKYLLTPADAVLDLGSVEACPPAGRCLHQPGEEVHLGRGFVRRGMVRALSASQLLKIRGEHLVNGWFGIGRGRFLEDTHATRPGAEVLRVIMNLTATNVIMQPFAGDIASLPYVGHWRTVILSGREVLVRSSEDLKGCFYLLLLPEAWAPYFAFDQEYTGAMLGLVADAGIGADEACWLGAITLPMGFKNAMGIAAYVHRRWTQLAAGNPRTHMKCIGLPLSREMRKDRPAPLLSVELARLKALWQTYCDDLDLMEKYKDLTAASLVLGTVHEWHEAMRKAYGEWQAVLSEGKAQTRVLEVKRLGAWVSGIAGRIGPPGERCGVLAGFTLFVRAQTTSSRKELQVAAGHWTNCFQYRKEASCIFNRLWRVMVRWGRQERRRLPSIVKRELPEALVCLPLLHMDLRAMPSDVTTASDACETGGGVCAGAALTQKGRSGLEQMLRQPVAVGRDCVGLITVGDELGGFRRALDLLSVEVSCFGWLDVDERCSRVLSQAWPDGKPLAAVTISAPRPLGRSRSSSFTSSRSWWAFACRRWWLQRP